MLKLRRTEPGAPLIISMTGLRLGDSVLFLGCHDPKALAQVAVKPGLSGRACAVDDDRGRVTAAEAAAQAEGALLETEVAPLAALPYAADTFDAVIAIRLISHLDPGVRVAAFHEAFRVVRPAGRCVVVEGGRRRGLAGLFAGAPSLGASDIEAVLQAAGFRGVRTLADRDGLLFLEGARPK
jgi:ubiquinone/menaquinone biosynthesis C-methylase UbiE